MSDREFKSELKDSKEFVLDKIEKEKDFKEGKDLKDFKEKEFKEKEIKEAHRR